MIELRKIDKDNYWECLSLKVAEKQANFVASNAVSLAEAWVFPEVAQPFAVYFSEKEEEKMVGFVMLACYPEKPQYEIWRLMIDQKFQGQGFGKSALQLAVDYLRREFQAEEILLGVEPENKGAEQLYRNFGFEKTGDIEDGEAVMKLVIRQVTGPERN